MLIIWGQRMYGRVDRFAGSYVATRFFHIYYVPLIPLSSWLVLKDNGKDGFIGTQVPMQGRSVLLAWARIATLLMVLGSIPALFSIGLMAAGAIATTVLMTAACVVAAFFAWFRLGKLSAEQKAARVVYSDFAGHFVDVALLKDQRQPLKLRTIEELDRHLARHATSSYREAPQSSWREIATRPDMRDVPLLKAALTRCRLEEADAQGPQKRELQLAHIAILRNLVAASPELLDTTAFELTS
ncbi:MAG: hypothetical protein ABI321_20460 [Polyangia bacterium]